MSPVTRIILQAGASSSSGKVVDTGPGGEVQVSTEKPATEASSPQPLTGHVNDMPVTFVTTPELEIVQEAVRKLASQGDIKVATNQRNLGGHVCTILVLEDVVTIEGQLRQAIFED